MHQIDRGRQRFVQGGAPRTGGRLAASRITPSEIRRLQVLVESMTEAIREGRPERVSIANIRFHDAIYSFARSPKLERLGRDVRHSVRGDTRPCRSRARSAWTTCSGNIEQFSTRSSAHDPEAAQRASNAHLEARARVPRSPRPARVVAVFRRGRREASGRCRSSTLVPCPRSQSQSSGSEPAPPASSDHGVDRLPDRGGRAAEDAAWDRPASHSRPSSAGRRSAEKGMHSSIQDDRHELTPDGPALSATGPDHARQSEPPRWPVLRSS